MMKVLAICGSRNPEGQTGQALDALLQGATDAGVDTETIFLPALDIQRCRQCDDDGWGLCRGGQSCTIQDDFASVVERLREADSLVVATPVYYGDISESLKAFLDRLRRLCTFGAGRDRIEAKPAVALCVAGGRGGGGPRCALLLHETLATCGFDVVDVIPARRQNLAMKCAILPQVGAWFATRPTSGG